MPMRKSSNSEVGGLTKKPLTESIGSISLVLCPPIRVKLRAQTITPRKARDGATTPAPAAIAVFLIPCLVSPVRTITITPRQSMVTS